MNQYQVRQQDGIFVVINTRGNFLLRNAQTKQPLTFPTHTAAQSFAKVQNESAKRHG